MRAAPPTHIPTVGFLQARLDFGGAERLIQDLARGLASREWRTILLTLKDPGPLGRELASDGVTVISGLARSRFDPWVGSRLADACRTTGIDVLYSTDSPMPLFWAGQLRRSGGPPLAVGFHTTGLRAGGFQHGVAYRRALPVADALIALAPSHRDFLARDLGVAPERFDVIGNGVDTRRFAPPADRAALRQKLGLPGQARIVTLVAALRPEKNHPMFLRAAAALAPRVPELLCLIAGDGPERPTLERMMAEMGPVPVRFLGARSDVPELIGASDVIALCSQAVVETMPLSLIEALACGTPVVSTRVGSIADIVVEGKTGLLVPAGDQSAFESALERMLGNPEMQDRMRGAARADAVARFGRDGMITAYDRLFRRFAQKRS